MCRANGRALTRGSVTTTLKLIRQFIQLKTGERTDAVEPGRRTRPAAAENQARESSFPAPAVPHRRRRRRRPRRRRRLLPRLLHAPVTYFTYLLTCCDVSSPLVTTSTLGNRHQMCNVTLISATRSSLNVAPAPRLCSVGLLCAAPS